MTMMNMIILMSLLLTLSKFISNNTFVLISLLSLELTSLLLYWMLSLNFSFLNMETYYLLYFLIMMICEGVLGLSILISLKFSHEANFMKLLNSSSC
uniref:NADH dehydrogenase subunit 4L n=1 Tax=Metacrangonyx dhofarensis TaxID=2291046 RepID=A0A345UDK6_9CRUS|nr:NADH dehydrogenase subunit 4L [Metacrangonyx dhofarensis]